MQYKLIITGPVGSGKTTAINSLTDQQSVMTDMPVSDAVTLARKSTTTVAMDYGKLLINDEAKSVVHVYGTPGQERFDFMWEILTEGADALIILLDNNRNYPFRDLKFFSEQFADFIAANGRLIIGVTRLDIREPLLPEVYEDWMEQLGLQGDVINIDPRVKGNVLGLVHQVLDLTPLESPELDTTTETQRDDVAQVAIIKPINAPSDPQHLHTIREPSEPITTTTTPSDNHFDINQHAMEAITQLRGVTGASITSELGELLDSTIDDEPLNQLIAYLSGLTPSLSDTAELGPIKRIMVRGPDNDNLTIFVEDQRALGVCSDRSVSVPALNQQVEDMLQWL